MTYSASATDRKIVWLISLAITTQLIARQAVPEGALQNMVLVISAAMNFYGLFLIFKNDWLNLRPLIAKIRARH